MAEKFDPYHKWLGIAPAEQPPNHYRLLGLNLFEPDLDVIENGSDRQMTHLRSFQSGPRMRECQQLLNEVANARVVLLNNEKKSAYDNALQAKIPPVTSPPLVSSEVPLTPADLFPSVPLAAPPTPPPAPPPAAAPAPAATPALTSKSPKVRTRRTRRRKKSKIGTFIAIGCCLLGIVVFGLLLKKVLEDDRNSGGTRERVPNDSKKQPHRVVRPSTSGTSPAEPEANPKTVDAGTGRSGLTSG